VEHRYSVKAGLDSVSPSRGVVVCVSWPVVQGYDRTASFTIIRSSPMAGSVLDSDGICRECYFMNEQNNSCRNPLPHHRGKRSWIIIGIIGTVGTGVISVAVFLQLSGRAGTLLEEECPFCCCGVTGGGRHDIILSASGIVGSTSANFR